MFHSLRHGKSANRQHSIVAKLAAIVLCVVAYCACIVLRSLISGVSHLSYWDYLILIAVWHAIWRWVVGVKNRTPLKNDGVRQRDLVQTVSEEENDGICAKETQRMYTGKYEECTKEDFGRNALGCGLGVIFVGIAVAIVLLEMDTGEKSYPSLSVDDRCESQVEVVKGLRELKSFAGFEFGKTHLMFDDICTVQKTDRAEEIRLYRPVTGAIEGLDGISSLYAWGTAWSNSIYYVKLVASVSGKDAANLKRDEYKKILENRFQRRFCDDSIDFDNGVCLFFDCDDDSVSVCAYDRKLLQAVKGGYEYTVESELPQLESFLGVKLGDDYQKYKEENESASEQEDGSFLVGAKMHHLLNFNSYQVNYSTDGKIIGVRCGKIVLDAQVDQCVQEVLNVLERKYQRLAAKKDKNSWRMDFYMTEKGDDGYLKRGAIISVRVVEFASGGKSIIEINACSLLQQKEQVKRREEKMRKENEDVLKKAVEAL